MRAPYFNQLFIIFANLSGQPQWDSVVAAGMLTNSGGGAAGEGAMAAS